MRGRRARAHFSDSFGSAPAEKVFVMWFKISTRESPRACNEFSLLDLSRFFEIHYTGISTLFPGITSSGGKSKYKILMLHKLFSTITITANTSFCFILTRLSLLLIYIIKNTTGDKRGELTTGKYLYRQCHFDKSAKKFFDDIPFNLETSRCRWTNSLFITTIRLTQIRDKSFQLSCTITITILQ